MRQCGSCAFVKRWVRRCTDAELLSGQEGQGAVAEAIASAILAFLG